MFFTEENVPKTSGGRDGSPDARRSQTMVLSAREMGESMVV